MCLGAYVTRENFENMMQFCAFLCIFDQVSRYLEKFLKNKHIWIKKYYYSYTFEFGYSSRKIFWKTSYNSCVLVYTSIAF